MTRQRVSRSIPAQQTSVSDANRKGKVEGRTLVKRRRRVTDHIRESCILAVERFAELSTREAVALRENRPAAPRWEVEEILEDLDCALAWINKINARKPPPQAASSELAEPEPPAG